MIVVLSLLAIAASSSAGMADESLWTWEELQAIHAKYYGEASQHDEPARLGPGRSRLRKMAHRLNVQQDRVYISALPQTRILP